MVEDIDKAALKLLQRGVELDYERRYTESLTCYQEGMQLLIDCMKSMLDPQKKKSLAEKVKQYMSRAESLKEYIKKEKEKGKYYEQIKIENNSTGFGYERVFGAYLDSDVVDITVQDPYIRTYPQCLNFLRFCELATKKCKNLKSIQLETTSDQDSKDQKKQEENLEKIKRSLQQRNIELTINYDPNLHDREIRLSNGWRISIGRGLEYFKRVEQFSVGFFDQDLRPCYETTVNIFHKNATRPL